MLRRSKTHRNSGRTMNRSVFAVLLASGSLGILIAFARARSRAVFEQDGFLAPGRRAAAVALLAVVLLLTVAIPFAGGLAGGEPDTKHLSLVSLFAVHGLLALFLAAYFSLTRGQSVLDFLRLRSSHPLANLSMGLLIG